MISESPTIALFSGRREYVATLRWFFFFFETTHYVGLLSVITDRAGVICSLLPCCRVMMSWRPVHRATQTVKDPNRLNNKDRPLLCPLLIRIRVVLFFKFFHIRSASPVFETPVTVNAKANSDGHFALSISCAFSVTSLSRNVRPQSACGCAMCLCASSLWFTEPTIYTEPLCTAALIETNGHA